MNSTTRKPIDEAYDFIRSLDGKIIVAFSGGSDSLGLLILLSSLVTKDNLLPVYVDHFIRSREELEKEISLNKSNCEKLGVPLEVVSLGKGAVEALAQESGCGTEQAARILRHKAMEEIRVKYGFRWIATAHNSDDQIETVLMRLFSGKAMPSFSGMDRINQNVVHPVLGLSHSELQEICLEHKLNWSEDLTNADNTYLRNRIRHQIIPAIAGVFPSYGKAVLNFSKQIRESLSSVMSFEKVYRGLDLNKLQNCNPIRSRAMIYAFWDEALKDDFTDLSNALAQRIYEAVNCGESTNIESSGVCVSIIDNRLFVFPKVECPYWEYSIDSELPGEKIALPGGHVLLRGTEASVLEWEWSLEQRPEVFLFPSTLEGRLIVRQLKPGDMFQTAGGGKSVARILQDMGVPHPLRAQVPIICDEKEVVAILGEKYGGKDRICRKCKCTLAPKRLYLYIVE